MCSHKDAVRTQCPDRMAIHFFANFDVFKVIPQYCIAHTYCARFLRH